MGEIPGRVHEIPGLETQPAGTRDDRARGRAGQLKVFIWDKAPDGWLPGTGGGKVLDTGWGQYDLITAAGDGVLYARKPTGELYRFPVPPRHRSVAAVRQTVG